MARKKFKDLTLSDAFLFSAALSHEEICREVLQIILGRSITRLQVRAEHNIMFSSDYHCVRLDVYASDEMKVGYDLEMQNKNEYDLPKRSRYYQAEMDIASLSPGEDYNKLKPTYIIFICTFDPFEQKLYQYTFEQRCAETGEPLGDETKRIFLSTKGKNKEDIPEVLVHFLKYIEDGTEACVEESKDKAIKKLHDQVTELKKSRELEGRFMQFEELLRSEKKEGFAEGKIAGRSEGLAEGLAVGHDRMLKLISNMASDGRQSEIPRLSEDPAFCEEMLKKYQL